MQKIDSFTGDYDYMDNSYTAHINIGGRIFMCVESAYQAARICDGGMSFMFDSMTGKEARRIGQDVTERPKWDNMKEDILYKLTLEKYKQNKIIRDKLLSTGDIPITEPFLGNILMRVRKELSEQN